MKRLTALVLSIALTGCSGLREKLPSLKFWGSNDQSEIVADGSHFAEFGRFIGTWQCRSQRFDDGTWTPVSGIHSWRWSQILGGQVIQDFWQPSAESAEPLAVGTNLRIFNEKRERWEIVWTTAGQQEWDLIWAEQVGANMVMHLQRPSRSQYKAHVGRITFHNIAEDHFDWKYDAAPLGDPRAFTEVSRMSCERS